MMKTRLHLGLLLSAFAVVFAFASASFAQRVGGYKVVAITDPGAVVAADFAVEAQSEKTDMEFELGKIVKAERQIVQGSNYRLCMEVSADGEESGFVQAVVYVDLKKNRKLSSWVNSTCGNSAGTASTGKTSDGFKTTDKNNAGVGLAADFAVKEESKVLKTPVDLISIVKAEMDEGNGKRIGAGTFRLCLIASGKGVGPGYQAIVSMDQYLNLKLISWTPSKCVETDGDYEKVDKAFTVGVDMAADFAVTEHSKDTGVPHKLVEILKREEKGMFSMNYRICMKVGEEGKTQTIQAIVTRDQYSNHKLVSWEHLTCGK